MFFGITVSLPCEYALSVSLRLTAPPEREPRGIRIIEESARPFLASPSGRGGAAARRDGEGLHITIGEIDG